MPPPSPTPTPVSQYFKLVFFTVLLLTIFSAVMSVYLLDIAKTSEEAKGLVKVFSSAFQLGIGAIVGLLGGKAL